VIELITDLSDFLNDKVDNVKSDLFKEIEQKEDYKKHYEKVMQDFAMSEEHQQIVDNLTQRVEVAEDKCARLEKNAEEN
jgi:hypothetical protein